MNSRLRALGGRINNIRASELPKEKTRSEITCNVHFLDGSIQSFKVNVSLENYIFFKSISICLKDDELWVPEVWDFHKMLKAYLCHLNCRVTDYEIDLWSDVLIFSEVNWLKSHKITSSRFYLENGLLHGVGITEKQIKWSWLAMNK